MSPCTLWDALSCWNCLGQPSKLSDGKREQFFPDALSGAPTLQDDSTRPVENLFVPSVREQLEAQVILGKGFERQAVFGRCLDLNLSAIEHFRVVVWLGYLVQRHFILKRRDDL